MRYLHRIVCWLNKVSHQMVSRAIKHIEVYYLFPSTGTPCVEYRFLKTFNSQHTLRDNFLVGFSIKEHIITFETLEACG